VCLPLDLQTFIFWLCTFTTNLFTSALFLSLALLFWFLAGGQTADPNDSARVTLTKFAGGWGFFVAFLALYDGTAALMKDVYGKPILPVFPLKPVNKVGAAGPLPRQAMLEAACSLFAVGFGAHIAAQCCPPLMPVSLHSAVCQATLLNLSRPADQFGRLWHQADHRP
jgi:hypothetical protein